MKSTVFFLRLTDEQSRDVNRLGWTLSPEGARYLDAKMKPDGWKAARHLYEQAAVVESGDVERIWMTMQNIEGGWAREASQKKPPHYAQIVSVHTEFPRSMDVGDVIVLGDGTAHICRSVGFEQIEGWQ